MKPLLGKRIMITRPEHQSQSLRAKLEALGAEVVSVPVVSIEPPFDLGPFQAALQKLDQYDWLVLTSANGVEAVRQEMEGLGIPAARLLDLKIAAIGPGTAGALKEWVREPDLVPEQYVSESIMEMLKDVAGQRFLLPRADLARKELANHLREHGATVDEITAYRIVRNPNAKLPDQMPDAVTVTSAEIARATVELLRKEGKSDWLKKTAWIGIGPITAVSLVEYGLAAHEVATAYDMNGLVEAVTRYFVYKMETTHA